MSRPATQPGQPVHNRTPRRIWAWTGVATGIIGLFATTNPFGTNPYPPDGTLIDVGVVDNVDTTTFRIAGVLGFVVIAGLLVLAAQWRRHVEEQLPDSTAARVVGTGLSASAAALTLGYGWMGALGLYSAGGPEENSFDAAGLYTYFILIDFSPFIGWLGVVVAAGGVAWMALRERVLPLWVGIFSVLPVLGTAVLVVAFSLPGAPGLFGSLWMIIAFIGVALSRPAPGKPTISLPAAAAAESR